MSASLLSRAVALCVCGLACAVACAFDVTNDGKPAATLVIPDKPLPVVTAAAEELQYHVRKASGAALPIVAESTNPAGPGRIYLGPCQATEALGLDLTVLKPNGFFIRSREGSLFLLGDDSAGDVFWVQHGNRVRVGTLFAVYELLEKHLGVRWLWPGPLGEVVPAQPTIRLDIADQTGVPAFVHTRWREGGVSASGPQGWASPQTRSTYLNEQGKWLRRHRFAMGVNLDMAHAYTTWWERFGKDHPEYFNLLPDGTRRSDPTYHGGAPSLISMSVGDPALWLEKIALWAERRSPAVPYVDASENDTAGKCVCDKCLALDVPDPTAKVPFEQRVAQAREAFAAGKPDWYEALGSLSDRYARYYLALQREAEKIDPEAVVMGYAYANYVKPPLATKLNPRIIIGIVPALMYPWTAEKRQAFIEQWNGWSAAGARLLLRPNYMLDGHNLPLNIARALGEDFSFAIKHGLIGTDFDSLTGQWATQGPNLYMLARLHEAPGLTPEQVLAEYYAAFGPAARAVQAYFDHWAAVSAAVTDAQYEGAGLHWSRFYRDADVIFTPAVMEQGRALLQAARAAAHGDVTAQARVAFLDNGLRNAELTLATQRAYRMYREKGDIQSYIDALGRLDAFRATVEGDFVANMAYLAWSEGLTWDRDLLKLMSQPGERLPDPWKFAWDPDKVGTQQRWFAPDFDASAWEDINTVQPWEQQEPGRKWKEAHRVDYDGVAWYRTTFAVKATDKARQVRLVFGAVDEACTVWLNGQPILERPYPYQGNTDSWREAFEVDVTTQVRFDGPNVLVVRVEDNAGAGGIWKPVWLLVTDPAAEAAKNALRDGGFEAAPAQWGQNVMTGRFRFAVDRTSKHAGAAAGLIECQELAVPPNQPKAPPGAWGRWYQVGVPVQPDKTYRFRAWYRTPDDFRGTVKLWVTGTEKQTMQVQGLNTQGLWRELKLEGIKPAGKEVGIYLNVMDGLGAVWFDDVELVPAAP